MDPRLANPLVGVSEFIPEPPAVAQEIAIDRAVVAVHGAADGSVAFGDADVAAQTAMNAEGRRELQVPLAGVMAAEGGIRKDAGRADLDQIAREFAFENAFPLAAE